MSATEIIAELPKLTQDELTAIARRIRELETEDSMLFMHEAAIQAFQEIDKTEAEGAHGKAR